MAQNPLSTALLCLVWKDNEGSFPESKTQLYEDITRCILQRYRTRERLPETKGDLIKEYKSQLKHLGQIAWNGLLDQKLDFEESELGGHADKLSAFGFLSVQLGSSMITPCRRFSFQHKSFQEWFAAFFLSCQLIQKDTSPEILVSFSRKNSHQLKEVLPFTCGLLAARRKEEAEALTKYIMQRVNQGSDGWLTVVLECTRECNQDKCFQAQLTRDLGLLLRLNTLRLAQRQIDATHVVLLGKVLTSNSTLTELDLSRNSISDAGAKSLAGALKSNSKLMKLYLTRNEIGDDGAEGLADGLRSNTTLSTLHLSSNGIADNGATWLAQALAYNQTMKILYLDNNLIGDAGAISLVVALESNATMTVLYLNKNRIGDAGVRHPSGALKVNTTLAVLELEGNKIGDGGAAHVADALRSNKKVTVGGFTRTINTF